MKKVVRLTESDLMRIVKRIIKESEINELGPSDFSDIENLNCVDPIGDLHVGIASLSSESRFRNDMEFLVVYHIDDKTNKKVVYGYGPQITDTLYEKKDDKGNPMICKLGKRLLHDMSEEYEENK